MSAPNELPDFTGQTLFSKAAHNNVVKKLRPLLKWDVVFGNKPGVQSGTEKTVLTLPDPRIWAGGASSTLLGMHPFKIYPTGTLSGSNVGYNVRVGLVDIRPIFHTIVSILNSNTVYAARVVPSDTDVTFGPSDYTPDPLPLPATFFLDPTPEVSGGVNYGANYSFWIQMDPDTDNGGAWNGDVTIQSQRFSIGPTPTDAFPGLPDGSGREFIPIGIVQVTAATSPLISVSGQSGDGLIWQMIHENQTNRFPAGQNGINGFCWQGDWSDPGNNSPNKVHYPGYLYSYYSGTPSDPTNAFYLWVGSPSNLGGTPTSPTSGGTPGSWAIWPSGL